MKTSIRLIIKKWKDRIPGLPTILFGVFFFGLASFDRDFSSLHVRLTGLPIYVGEIFLLIGLIHFYLRNRRNFISLPTRFITGIWVFLFWGSLLFLDSLFRYRHEYPLIQILRDFALVYQCLWVLVIAGFSKREWKFLFLFGIFGLFFRQFFEWYCFLTQGQLEIGTQMGGTRAIDHTYKVQFFGGIAGSDVLGPLMPLSFPLVSGLTLFALMLSYGFVILGQLLVYFKKTWIIAFFILSLPLGMFFKKQSSSSSLIFSKIRPLIVLAGLSLGLFSVCFTTRIVNPSLCQSTECDSVHRIFPCLDFLKFRSNVLSETPDLFFLHAESGSKPGEDIGRMAWRMHMWNQAWTLAKKFHFLGSGYGPKPVFTDVWGYPSIAYSKWISGPHNSFLTVLFRTGLLGLLSVFFVFFSALLICAKNLKNNERAPILFLAIIGIGFFASFNVCLENPQAGIWFWFFLGSIIPNLVNTPEREDPR